MIKLNKKILINIIISTLPIFSFIIADYFFKEIWKSITISIGICAVEFILSLIIYKRIEYLILLDAGLIIAFGLISIFAKNPLFFKIKPALIELILCIMIIPMIVSRRFFKKIVERYTKGIKIDEARFKLMQKSLITIPPVIIIHIVLIVISALFLSKEMWGFISGVFLYILFGIIFLAMIFLKKIKTRMFLNKYADDEWFDIVDEKGRITGKAPRAICHDGSKLLHPVIHVHIFNKKREILLQKRALTKKIQPGKWDTSVGGHIRSGESLIPAIKREVLEEIGIDIDEKQLIPIKQYVFESKIEKEFISSFVYFSEGPFQHQKEEIDKISFFDLNSIKEMIENNTTTPNFAEEFPVIENHSFNFFLKII